jgi:dolichyl-diphosphooligosaccharide--protein glycosyltransferase
LGFVHHDLLVDPEPGGPGLPDVVKLGAAEAQHTGAWAVLAAIHQPLVSLAGLAGLMGLALGAGRRFLGLMPILFLGALSLVRGNRFAMYLAPFVGMGLGFLVSLFLSQLGAQMPPVWRQRLRYPATIASFWVTLALCFCFGSFTANPPPRPWVHPRTYRAYQCLSRLGEEAAVWAAWDHGYPIQDIGRQPTYADGGAWSNASFIEMSLMQTTPEAARNVMLGFTNVAGAGTLEERLTRDGTARFLQDLASGRYTAPPERPVYVVLNYGTIPTFGWTVLFGTWDSRSGTGTARGGHYEIREPQAVGDWILGGDLVIDKTTGYLLRRGKEVHKLRLVQMVDYTGDPAKPETRDIVGSMSTPGDLVLQIVRDREAGDRYYVMNDVTYASFFHQAFFLDRYGEDYFDLVYSDFPFTKILRVKGRRPPELDP